MCAALLLGLAPLSVAWAQEQGGRVFQRIDTNGDGPISKDEMLAARERLFKRLDRNGDGVIDKDEIEGARDAIMDRADAAQSRLGTAFRRMDANVDGKVSEDECRARMPLFALADRNGDGKLSADEIAFIRQLIAGRAG